eukprot:TRINITY_DN8651_c0_g1_i1.p1 TRINITY_DN8651_c0_g1~~TRINITY_DN8651_c0_g1_i1.p1  ORF type:complete len:379 (+),score=70.87 TRINITY_DN8651_c0_g1_i1:174-1310(+)
MEQNASAKPKKNRKTILKPSDLARKQRGSRRNNGTGKVVPRARAQSRSKNNAPIRRKTRRKRTFWTQLKGKFCMLAPEVDLEGAALLTVEILGISEKQLKSVKAKFDGLDMDGSGEIDYEEFFSFVGESRSPYADALFAFIDEDGSGSIDFNEFIQVMSTYCMYGKDEILKFCFETFDKDGSGSIDEAEFVDLCKTINATTPLFPGNFKKALEQFDKNDDGLIDFDEFKEINRRYPMVMFPAFRLQDQMQKCTLGESAWQKVMKNQKFIKDTQKYCESHGGAFPPKKIGQKIKDLLCCSDSYSKFEEILRKTKDLSATHAKQSSKRRADKSFKAKNAKAAKQQASSKRLKTKYVSGLSDTLSTTISLSGMYNIHTLAV